MKQKCLIILLIMCSTVVYSIESSVLFSNSNNEVRFSWTSSVHQTYKVLSSTNLLSGFDSTNTIQATPPNNQWWSPMNDNNQFFQLVENSVTNVPPTPAVTTNIIKNGTFENGSTNWVAAYSASSTASGTSVVQNEEMFFDINSPGDRHYHAFLRQFDLNIVNGTNYTLSFEARAEAPRTIHAFIGINSGGGTKYWEQSNINIGTSMSSYSYTFNMSSPTDPEARIHIGVGDDVNDVWIDNVELTYPLSGGGAGAMRAVAHEKNRRLARGNNFMAAKAINGHGKLQDYELLHQHHFSHCRIGYKMDERALSTSPYTIPETDINNLRDMVDWCNQMGLIAIVDPVHNWMANDSEGGPFDQSVELEKLSNIWLQVATEFANDSLDNVFFEIVNEPRDNSTVTHNAQEIIATGLAAVRSIAGNEQRIVIICGDGFSTRQALIDEFDNNNIPVDDNYLIGTFHYYDPFAFTKQGDTSQFTPGLNWGTDTEFGTVETHFDAVVTANNDWALRNNTQPLPIYLGEFGVDNEADNHHTDRKKWLSWIRMQAEKRGFSWAHWNMYSNVDTAKGMGPWEWVHWQTTQPNNMQDRYFDLDPVEALIGRYEFEDGNTGGGVQYNSNNPGYSGSGYADYPSNQTGFTVFAQINSIYVPKTGTYKIKIHYASDEDKILRVVSRKPNTDPLLEPIQTGLVSQQLFPSTGGLGSWDTIEILVDFEAGESNDLRIYAIEQSGAQLDWLHITL